ncbi:hypothetical protein H4F05_00105 [Vibrio cholerae]
MLLTLVILLAIVLTALLAHYYHSESVRRKSRQDAKQTLLLRSKRIKQTFKGQIERFCALDALTPETETAVLRLANLFFVFQPVNSHTVEQYQETLNNLVKTIDERIDAAQETSLDMLSADLERFAASLPKANSAYTASFYRNDLPAMIYHLSNQTTTSVSDEATMKPAPEMVTE